MARDSLDVVSGAYAARKDATDATEGADVLPQNKAAGTKDEDNLLRYLDCAVIRHLHAALADAKEPPYDSVRGLFTEGGALFPGSGFQKKTHTQVAVRQTSNIKGLFRVPRPE